MTLLVVYGQYVILVPPVCLYAICDNLYCGSIRVILYRGNFCLYLILHVHTFNGWPSRDVKVIFQNMSYISLFTGDFQL